MSPRRFEIAVLAVVASVIGYQLFCEPLLGLADNGDFPRLLQPAGLVERTVEYHDRYFHYFNSRYTIGPWAGGVPAYKSSSLLFVALGRVLNVAFVDRALFDVRTLGAVYLLCWLAGLHLVLVSTRRLPWPWRTALAAALVLMATDPAYTAYFNSFYSEPTALVCLLAMVGCALVLVTGETASGWMLAGYFLAAALLVTAKPMFVLVALLAVPHGLYLSGLTTLKRRYRVSAAMASLLVVLAVWYYTETPVRLRSSTHYLAVFRVLLDESRDREGDARDLGLRPEWTRYAGTGPYMRNSPVLDPAFHAEFTERVNSLTVPRFFLRHPDRFYVVLSRLAARASAALVSNLGYYEKHTGLPPLSKPRAPWSEARRWLMPASVWSMLAYFGSGLVALVVAARRGLDEPRRGLATLHGAITAFGAIVFFVPALVVASTDARYAITLVQAFDATLLLALGAVFAWASGRERC